MPVTKAQIRATNKYMSKNYDSLRIVVPKGQKAAIEAFAREQGQSINGLVNALLRAAMGLSEADWKGKQE